MPVRFCRKNLTKFPNELVNLSIDHFSDFRVLNFEFQVDTDSDNVRVVVRCRPMNEKEIGTNCGLAVNVEESRGIITVKNPSARTGEPPKQFTYDRVFGVDTKQVDVYNDAARPIVNCVLEGYNGENHYQ